MEIRLRVDPVACDGFGYCAELFPEFIALDEWGYPVVPREPVPHELRHVAEMTVDQCPRKALSIERIERTTPVTRIRLIRR